MKKLLLSLVTLLCMVTSATAGDVLYKTLTFPCEKADSISAYDKTWTATHQGLTWTIFAFNNNNKWSNNWTYIRCGRKSVASVATITTGPIAAKLSKVDVTIDAFIAGKINTTYLEVASDKDFTQNVQKIELAIAEGVMTYAIPTKVANGYYRLTYDCAVAGKNGAVTLSKIELYQFDESRPSNPIITPGTSNLYEATDVTITTDAGNTLYYSTDSVTFNQYTAPINIAATTTLYAYAEKAGAKSDVVKATYTMAKTYASLDVLLQETPTDAGWPVIVPIKDEVIDSFYVVSSYRNGVFLTREAGGKKFEFYCANVPETWSVGDKLSGTAKGIYQQYKGQWEISLINWDGLSNGKTVVTAPTITFEAATKTVTITAASEDYNIFYTTDGSTPTDDTEGTTSKVYEGPFTVAASTTVKAICTDENDQPSSVTTLYCALPCKTIAELIENCTETSSKTAPTITFQPTGDVLVTGVNGGNVFVRDATGSFCFYGNSSNLAKGDIIGGSITGLLYSYNGQPELSVSDKWASMTKISSGNTVTPTTVAAGNVTKADANKYVRIENLTYVSQQVVSKKNEYTLTDGANTVILYDKFAVLDDIVWAASCTYHINVMVIPFNTTVEYYACSASEVEVISSKQTATITINAPADNQLYTYSQGGEITLDVQSVTDATLQYSSSDEKVASFDGATLTMQGTGVTTLTIEAPETETYMAAKASVKIRICSGNEGSLIEAPYEAGDVLALFTGDTISNKWIHGYIVGYIIGSSLSEKTANFSLGDSIANTNILLANTADDKTVARVVPVNLPTTAGVRAAINLKDNPSNFEREVWLYGKIVKYMGIAGIKNITRYSFDGTDGINDIDADVDVNVDTIYNLAGQRVTTMQKGNIYILNGRKVMY